MQYKHYIKINSNSFIFDILLFTILLSIVHFVHSYTASTPYSNVVYKKVGDDVALNCDHGNISNASLVLWKKDKKEKKEIVYRESVSDQWASKSILKFTNVTFKHSGIYTCEVYPLSGEHFATSTLLVIQGKMPLLNYDYTLDSPDIPLQPKLTAASASALIASWMFGGSNNSSVILHNLHLFEG